MTNPFIMKPMKLLALFLSTGLLFCNAHAQKTLIAKTSPVYLDVGNGNQEYSEADIVVTWITPDDVTTKHNENNRIRRFYKALLLWRRICSI